MRRCLSALLLIAWLPGCVHWEPTTVAAQVAVPVNRELKIWSAGQSVQWRAVQVSHDSISGVPYGHPTSCTACRRALPLAAVDSTQMRTSEALPVILAAAPFVFLVVVLVTNGGGFPSGAEPLD